MNFTTTSLFWAACSLASVPALATNIVQNPGFELGSQYWDSQHFIFGTDPLWAHTGPGNARLTYCSTPSCVNTIFRGAFFGQLLSTRPGDLYDLSFWVRSFNGESRLSVFWDGVMLSETGTPNGPMLQYKFSGLAASANATLLEIHGYNSINEHMSFDDFNVMKLDLPPAGTAPLPGPLPAPPMGPAAPAPLAVSEPAGAALLLAAMGAAAVANRRSRSRRDRD